jgi:hypothetical protein
MDHDLREKFERRLNEIQRGEEMKFEQHDDYLTQIMHAPLCKKCKACYERDPSSANNMPHHKDIVKSTVPRSSADSSGVQCTRKNKRRCRYVLLQQWFDFLVKNRQLLEQSPDEKDSLKRIMLAFHQENVVSPNFEWHFWQLFQEHLSPKVIPEPAKRSVDVNKGNGFDRYREYYKEEEKKVLHEKNVSSVTILNFLMFFVGFYVEEYGYLCDKNVVTDLNMNTTLYELNIDDLGKINLIYAIQQKFPDDIYRRFENGIITFEAFEKCNTVGDLFHLVTGNEP